MTQSNPFSSPAAPGAPDPAPRPRDLVGCLVAYSPREFTAAGAPGNEKGVGEGANASPPRDRVTADLIVLSTPGDQPVVFGGSPEWERKPTPHYLSVGGPARFDGVWVNNQTIVKALAPGGQPLVGQLILGVIERSTFGNMPFNLVAVDGTPQMAKAIEIYTALSMGAMAYRTPQPIPGAPVPQKANAVPAGPMPPANSVNYGYPPAPAPVMPPMPGIPTPPGQPAPAVPPAFDFAAFQAQQAQAALAAAGLQPTPVSPWGAALPTQIPKLQAQGWTPETWAQLNPEQAAQVLATVPAF
jgi:hypothetical protein